MVVQSKKIQGMLLFFSVVFILSLGIIGFRYLNESAKVNPEEGRYYAEVILYLSFLFAVVIAGLYGYAFFRNRNILKELDKIIEMSLYSNFSPLQSLDRLSTIGEKIGQIYKNVNTISEKRALKISSLHGLTEFLLDNVTLPIVITDVRGVVTLVSKEFRDKYPEQTDLATASIINFLPELQISSVLEEFEENYSTVGTRLGRIEVNIYPIRNYEYEIAYLVFVIGKGNLVQDEVLRKIPDNQRSEKVKKGMLAKLFNRRKRY